LSQTLGVEVFKRRWEVRGSFSRKLQKNSISDLEQVIQDANYFTNFHVNKLSRDVKVCGIAITLFLTGVNILCHFKRNTISRISRQDCFFFIFRTMAPALSIFIQHGYALMVHRYNRILANKRKQLLLNYFD